MLAGRIGSAVCEGHTNAGAEHEESASFLTVFFSLAPMQTFSASLRVDCVEGCVPRGTDPTVDLLLRSDETSPITLRWETTEDPSPGEETLRLCAGNPALQDQIPTEGS